MYDESVRRGESTRPRRAWKGERLRIRGSRILANVPRKRPLTPRRDGDGVMGQSVD
jgi:hypothetical protein